MRKHLVSSQKWYDMVVSKSKKDGVSMKQIVDNALEGYFNNDVNTIVNSTKSVNTLEDNVNKILQMLTTALTLKTCEISSKTQFLGENSVTSLARGLDKDLDNNYINNLNQSNPSNHSVTPCTATLCTGSVNTKSYAEKTNSQYSKVPEKHDVVKFARTRNKPEATVHDWFEWNEKRGWPRDIKDWRSLFMGFAKKLEQQ